MEWRKKRTIMAEFCGEECLMIGAICDFCEYFDQEKQWCNKLNIKVRNDSGTNCEDFVCYRCKKVEQTIFVPKRDKGGKPLFPKEMYEDWD
jgi:hypothetical protein